MKRQVYVVWFLIFLAWAFYRANFFLPEWVDEFIAKPVIFVYPLLLIWLVIEKRNLKDLPLFKGGKDLFIDLFLGVVIGILFAFEGLYSNFFKYGRFSFAPVFSDIDKSIYYLLFINPATSLWEEILGRGYLYQRLFAETNRQLWSATTASFLSLLLHIPIVLTRLDIRGFSLVLFPLTNLFLGMTNCYVYSWRRSLTLPVLVHTFWNMTMALYL